MYIIGIVEDALARMHHGALQNKRRTAPRQHRTASTLIERPRRSLGITCLLHAELLGGRKSICLEEQSNSQVSPEAVKSSLSIHISEEENIYKSRVESIR